MPMTSTKSGFVSPLSVPA